MTFVQMVKLAISEIAAHQIFPKQRAQILVWPLAFVNWVQDAELLGLQLAFLN